MTTLLIVVEAWTELTNQIEVPRDEAPPTEELVARIQEAIWHFCYPYHINNSVRLVIPQIYVYTCICMYTASANVVCNG